MEEDLKRRISIFKEHDELTEQEKKDLFDFSKPFFHFNKYDILKKDEEGNITIYGKKVETLGDHERYVDILCRLKAIGYINSTDNIDYSKKEGGFYVRQSKHKIMLKYIELLKELERLKLQYGDNAYKHINEIQDNKYNEEKTYDINYYYNKLKENYQKYLESLSPKDREELQTASLIYNSVLFIPINEMTSIEGWEDKNAKELIELCDENEDFKDFFHKKYQEISRTLQNGYGTDYDIINQMSTILDLSSEEAFLESLKKTVHIIDKHKNKITVPEDLLVYRGVASDEFPQDLSKGNIISTSISHTQAEHFTNRRDKPYHILDCILLRKGTPYIMPLTEQAESQKEIMIMKDAVNTKCIGFQPRDIDMEFTASCCPIIYYEVEPIEKIKEKTIHEPKIEENIEDNVR